MSICDRCGSPITFRHVDGRAIPIHSGGGCRGANSRAATFSGNNASQESTSFATSCPKCGEEVYFVRHNGGSVWLDPPLGSPWYKHFCFDSDYKLNHKQQNLLKEYDINYPKSENLILGVVKQTTHQKNKRFIDSTDIFMVVGDQEELYVEAKNNAGFLLGKLCLLDKQEKLIWPIAEKSYRFAVLSTKDQRQIEQERKREIDRETDLEIRREIIRSKKLGVQARLMACPVCNAMLNPKNYKKHLREQHGNE